MPRPRPRRLLSALRSGLAPHGLDLVTPFRVGPYNAAVEAMPPLSTATDNMQLPDLDGRAAGTTLAFLVGNTKALWHPFVRSLRRGGLHEALLGQPNPLDLYVERTVRHVLQRTGEGDERDERDEREREREREQDETGGAERKGARARGRASSSTSGRKRSTVAATGPTTVRFSHRTAPGELIAIQQLCHLSGLAYLSKRSHLCIHRQHGPWIALRSVIVCDVSVEEADVVGIEGGGGASSGTSSGGLKGWEGLNGLERDELLASSDRARSPHEPTWEGAWGTTAGWDVPCSPSMEAKAEQATARAIASGGDPDAWRQWLAVRDVYDAPEWVASRYDDAMLRYHYTYDEEVLRRAVDAASGS